MDYPLYQPQHEHDACGIGFVAQKDGRRSHAILESALTALANHAHRGAVAADGKSGDGAGVLTQLPYELIAATWHAWSCRAPGPGDLAVGMVFLPRYNLAHRERARKILEETVAEYGIELIGWRDVPVDGDALGEWAQSLRPYIEQIVLARPRQHRRPAPSSSASSTSSASTPRSASGPRASPTSTCRRCRAKRSSTKGSSSRPNCPTSTPT